MAFQRYSPEEIGVLCKAQLSLFHVPSSSASKKKRAATGGQLALFEQQHPRAPAGSSGKYRGGEFVPRTFGSGPTKPLPRKKVQASPAMTEAGGMGGVFAAPKYEKKPKTFLPEGGPNWEDLKSVMDYVRAHFPGLATFASDFTAGTPGGWQKETFDQIKVQVQKKRDALRATNQEIEGKNLPNETLARLGHYESKAKEEFLTGLLKLNPPMRTEPWQMSAAQYQHEMGVDAPWIGEVSEYQMSRMGGRQKKQYQEKRAKEWDASARVKRGWAKQVWEAYQSGKFKMEDPGVHEEARMLVKDQERAEKEQREQEARSEAIKGNYVSSPDQLKVGESYYWSVGRKMVKVLRVNPKSVTVEGEYGRFKVAYGDLSFKDPATL